MKPKLVHVDVDWVLFLSVDIALEKASGDK